MRRLIFLTLLASMAAIAWADTASAFERTLIGGIAHRRAQGYAWHGGYYDAAWGMPVALVVPPTAEYQTNWGWGVGNTRVTPIYHQFERNYPGAPVGGRGFRPTPPWPSNTTQFGDYYIRGPW
jgi:hypothetical protein